ncbi:MAG: cytosolic protein, partial [Deltaproteobacteria bacterium]
RLIGLGDQPGLDGLKEALKLRLYAYVNEQSIVDETDSSFVFQMNQCRVQNSRKRKGLDDYPCKSAGMVEYPRFATAIDKRIKTECIGCPPDPHPEEWFCAWKFTLEE